VLIPQHLLRGALLLRACTAPSGPTIVKERQRGAVSRERELLPAYRLPLTAESNEITEPTDRE
jgi:hypothetical protein